MIGEPEAGEEVLRDNHAYSYHHGVGNTQFIIATQTVTAKNGTTDDGLQKIVGKTHASKNTQMMEYISNALKGIPCRDYCRHNHQEDDEVVEGLEP